MAYSAVPIAFRRYTLTQLRPACSKLRADLIGAEEVGREFQLMLPGMKQRTIGWPSR